MALTERQKKRMEKLDFQMGGGFSDFLTDKRKLDPSDSKFLFVGLGGRGTDTVARLRTEVYKKIKSPEGKTKPDGFEFLAVDTDANHLKDLSKGGFGEIGLDADPGHSEFCQLFDANAAAILKPENRHQLPENVAEWLNPQINANLQGEGANGIRQAGRYLLFANSSFSALESSLRSKLQKLHNQINNPATQKMIVYVFAGVGGGTGSGTIIDVPYIVREICRRNAWDVKVYGYIYLPDCYPAEAAGAHLRYNSYAALKEIDTLMNINAMDGLGRFTATYKTGFSVDSTEKIFDSCVLVSGKKTTGLVPQPSKYTMRVVVSNIINLVVQNSTDSGYLANSFLDNTATEIANAVVAMSEKNAPRNSNYNYTIIGTGALVLPIEQILAYVSQGTMNMLRAGWDKHPQSKDVEEMLHIAPMLPDEQANNIIGRSTVPLMQYTKGIGGKATKEDVISGALMNTLKQYHMTQNVSLMTAWDIAKHQNMEQISTMLNNYYEKRFSDPEWGIYFLKELISARVMDGSTINGALMRIKTDYMDAVQALINGQYAMQSQLDAGMREIVATLDTPALLRPTRPNGVLIEEYRELCVAKLVSESMVYLYSEIVRDCIKQIITWFENKERELQVYIDTFSYMSDVVSRNYKCAMGGKMPTAEFAGVLLDFSDGSDTTQKVLHYLDAMLNEKTPEGLVSALEDSLKSEGQKWILSEESYNPMRVFVSFLEGQFGALPELTMEKFLTLKYGTDGLASGMQEVCQELKDKAEYIFPTREGFAISALAQHRYVVMPGTTEYIDSAISGFATTEGATVAKSSDLNSLYWYNLAIGVPMFANLDVDEYEKLYEGNPIIGMHMKDNANESWKNMPVLTNSKLWPQKNANPRERKIIEETQALVQEMENAGFLFQEPTTGAYRAYAMPNDAAVTKESIVEWTKKYLEGEECVLTEEGLYDSEKGFVEKLTSENDFVSKLVSINIYCPATADNLAEVVRENHFLLRELQKIAVIYRECKVLIENKNKDIITVVVERKKRSDFYDFVRVGIVVFEDDKVVLVPRDGVEKEVMYFDDYSNVQLEYAEYYAYKEFYEKYDEEYIAVLNEYAEELAKDRSDEARANKKARSDKFMDSCSAVIEKMKKLDTRRNLKQIGLGDMIEKFEEFYNNMLPLRKG